VLPLAAVALREPDAPVGDTVDRADVDGVRADHFRVLGRSCPWSSGLSLWFLRLSGAILLEQDFESALAAIPSGYGECMYEGYGTASPDGHFATESGLAVSRERSRYRDVVSLNHYRLRSGEALCVPAKCRPRRSSRLFSGMPHGFKQGCAVWCDASLPAEREQGTIRPAMFGGIIAEPGKRR
jgi:hypothetical protein